MQQSKEEGAESFTYNGKTYVASNYKNRYDCLQSKIIFSEMICLTKQEQ
jgi:hypothetical protein